MTWKPAWGHQMPTPAPISEKWVDIAPPGAPPDTMDPFTCGIVVAVIVVLISVAVILYRRPRSRAKWALRRLARDLQDSRIEAKPACVRIKQCLRTGLGRRDLQSVQWSEERYAGWHAYVKRLTEGCFAAPSPSRAELDSLIHEALAWLEGKAVDA